jgi:hypothetical protein
MASFQVVELKGISGNITKNKVSMEVTNLAGFLCKVQIEYECTGRVLDVSTLVDSLSKYGEEYKDLYSLGDSLHSELRKVLKCEVLKLTLVDIMSNEKKYELRSKRTKKRKKSNTNE